MDIHSSAVPKADIHIVCLLLKLTSQECLLYVNALLDAEFPSSCLVRTV